jgi:release factor glutamine methyltransferase
MKLSIQECLLQVGQQLVQVSETGSLDAQVLIAHHLEKTRSWVLAHPETPLSPEQQNGILIATARIVRGEPLPYVIGHWEFFGLDFHLTPAVLIPRPETELLVERAINWLRAHPTRRKAIDVGTGSGCIGIALAVNIPDIHILLTDISSQALNVAHMNADDYGLLGRLEFIRADLLDGISGPFDMICANLPYIPTPLVKTLPVSEREPHLALDGGSNGTAVINRLLEQARDRLSPGGLLLLEIESSQGQAVTALAKVEYPTSKVQILKDLAGKDRCIEIERPDLFIHICPRDEWQQALQEGMYQDESLFQDGFIHCSQPEQLLGVANRFYRGIPDLVLLSINPDKLTSEVRWEPADDTLFPHIYGPINLEAVISVNDLRPELDGFYHAHHQPG